MYRPQEEKERFLERSKIVMSTITKFVAWILGMTHDEDVKVYFDKVGEILDQFEIMPIK